MAQGVADPHTLPKPKQNSDIQITQWSANTPSTDPRVFNVLIFSGNLYGKVYWATLPTQLLDRLWATYNRRHPNSSTNNWNSSSRSDQWIPESKAMALKCHFNLGMLDLFVPPGHSSLLCMPLLALPSSILNIVYSVLPFFSLISSTLLSRIQELFFPGMAPRPDLSFSPPVSYF